jgi:hypothetical protein
MADTSDPKAVVKAFVELQLADEGERASPLQTAALDYRIKSVRTKGNWAVVFVKLLVVYHRNDIESYYRPARWVGRGYELVQQSDERGGAWEISPRSQLPQLSSRQQAREIGRKTLYYVIAGSFRSKTAAEKHRHWVETKFERGDPESGFLVERSSDHSGLRPGYQIVVNLEQWQFEKPQQAQEELNRLHNAGVSGYIRRIPPM